LAKNSVVSILETTAADGKNYQTRYYNLDAIIAVGYRVNSFQATQFRIWATQTLREFLIKGFVMDDNPLFPALRSGPGSLNGLNPKSKFLAIRMSSSPLIFTRG
jgi:hypothetical protein